MTLAINLQAHDYTFQENYNVFNSEAYNEWLSKLTDTIQ